jgi:N-acetylglucosaminyldiphosphoundecaprenol N-acetyl-beta-D-mannosaminyltransferase
MYRHRQNLPHTLSLGLGATLEFLAGEKTRSPAWMSRWGLEWFYRLGQEPGRLFYRYLVRDMRFVPIAYRMLIDREKILKKHSKELNSSIVE